MATRNRPSKGGAGTGLSADEYMAMLEHPYKNGVEALRKAILGVDERIREEVKWNAPSYRLEGHFATFRLHPAPMFQLVLHTETKPATSSRQFHLEDPDGLVK